MARFEVMMRDRLAVSGLEPGSISDSIQKWEFIRDHIEEIREISFWKSCSLCQKYNIGPDSEACVGCPIFKATGFKGCVATPYVSFKNLFDYGQFTDADIPGLKRLAQLEIDFLKSLPEE